MMIVKGGCYCGAVRYRVDGEPLNEMQCHCRECQYISGGGINYCMIFASPAFEWIKGTPKTYIRPDLANAVARDFCGNCGTPLTTRPPGAGIVVLKVGSLDDPSRFSGSKLAIFTADAPKFHPIDKDMPRFESLPG